MESKKESSKNSGARNSPKMDTLKERDMRPTIPVAYLKNSLKKKKNASPLSKEVEEYETVFEKSYEILDNDIEKSSWYSFRIFGQLPTKRSNHVALFHQNKYYILGGVDIKEDTLADVWELDLEKFEAFMEGSLILNPEDDANEICWKKIDTTGDPFPKISHHSAHYYENQIIVYGGLINYDNNANSLYSLDLRTYEWKLLKSENCPEGRDSHSSVLFQNQMFIHGGFVNGTVCNQTWKLNLENMEWGEITSENGPLLASHSAVITNLKGQNYMYIFGGLNESHERTNSLWRMELDQYYWEEITHLDPPIPRSNHSAISYGNYMLVFGGILNITKEVNDLHIYSFGENKWEMKYSACLSPVEHKSFPTSSPKKNQNQNLGGTAKHLRMYQEWNAGFGDSPSRNSNAPNIKEPQSKSVREESKQKAVQGSPVPKTSPKVVFNTSNAQIGNFDFDILQNPHLLTPTTTAMLNSGIIKGADKSFDVFYNNQVKKRKKQQSTNAEEVQGCIQGRIPPARSGHSATLFGGSLNKMMIFGGDRHQVAFNDSFILDIDEILGSDRIIGESK